MDYLISEKIIFTEGYKNAAIYDLNHKKVYSINDTAKDIINRVILRGELPLSKIEDDYIKSLISNELYNKGFKIEKYKIDNQCAVKLNFAWLEITQACNLKCLHCYEGETHNQSGNSLDVDNWINIIDQLYDVGCRRIQFIGGEPCIHPKLISLIDYAKTKGFESITIFTNATILNDDLLDCLLRNNVNIRFSIYGHTAQIHDTITQVSGSFEKTVMNIKRLMKLKINVSAAVIIMRENQDFTDDIKTFIESLRLKYSGYDVIRNVYGGKQSNHTPTNEVIINNSIRSKPEFFINEEAFNEAHQTNTCWYGKFAITETGVIIPCVFERSIILGDIKKQSIQKILDSEILKKHWFLTFNQVKTCMDCEFKYACRDCRPLGISKCGELFDKNPRCSYNPITGDWKTDRKKASDCDCDSDKRDNSLFKDTSVE